MERWIVAGRIEDYALIGDTQTAALVCRDGSIDWLCLPRFDSGAVFAALLGAPDNGRWLLAPAGEAREIRRSYLDQTLVLDTEFRTEDGTVSVIDFMPPRGAAADLVRIVEGRAGRIPMRMELRLRFDYGRIVPWVRKAPGGVVAIAGPDSVWFHTDVPLRGEDLTTVADFTVAAGQRVPFVLTWHPSHRPLAGAVEPLRSLDETAGWWREWAASCRYEGEWRDAVDRSLITLKALTYGPTGGIVASPTTSLPEKLGGIRNWDYRFCWVRDATFTLYALLLGGFEQEAREWREWLLRAVAGSPSELQIMYGPAGERRLTELELEWLSGYDGSAPVRVGNAAHSQFQLDVYGEVMDALHQCRNAGIAPEERAWDLQRALMEFLEGAWSQPDEGIWEVRGPRRHFTHSKVMAWVAMDRAVKDVERFGLRGPVDRWREIRDLIREEVLKRGYDPERGTFVQYYGGRGTDASLLMLPLVGFVEATDPRMMGTIEAIRRELSVDGLLLRYVTEEHVDGLPPGEGVFLACTFWLAANLALLGRTDEARELFERLLDLRNDVGLLSEQYDPRAGRFLGNFPQALSHLSLVNTASSLSRDVGPVRQRRS